MEVRSVSLRNLVAVVKESLMEHFWVRRVPDKVGRLSR